MPIVNIRDDDGNVMDSINLPTASGSGNYAPANAIIDQSPLIEWQHGRFEPILFDIWKWTKHIDGTFSLYGEFTMCLEYWEDEYNVYEVLLADEEVPFDVYDITSSSVSFVHTDEGLEAFNTIDFNISSGLSAGGYPSAILIDGVASDETYEIMREQELSMAQTRVLMIITGRWRED